MKKDQYRTALVLGSGLGSIGEEMETEEVIPYQDLKGFPVSTVEGHKGQVRFGRFGDVPLIVFQGRVHFYEGYSMEEVVHYVFWLHDLGVRTLILTNAAGCLNENFAPGDLMMIRDQITSFVPSPLVGMDPAKTVGVRFPDMTAVYDPDLMNQMQLAADRAGISLKEGVYLQTTGPNYETPAEIRMFRTLGADAVGMSTGVEAMTASALGMRVAGISLLTNMAAGLSAGKLSHREVTENAGRYEEKMTSLLRNLMEVVEVSE